LRAAVVFGTAAGLVDGVATLQRNFYATHFALACLSAPVVLTTALLCLAAFPCAVVGRARRCPAERWPARVSTQLVGLVLLLWTVLWWARVVTEARAVGANRALATMTLVPMLLLAWVAMRATGATLARMDGARLRRLWHRSAIVAGALNLLACVALGSVARTEGREYLSDSQVGGTRKPIEVNVLLITIDTLRADRLATFGGRAGLTPRLDGLAADGVAFTTAISQSSWTLPSLASLFTGLPPSRHGAGWSTEAFNLLARAPLSDKAWIMTETLREKGYATHAVVTNPYLAMHYGLGRGFGGYENVSIESEAFLALRETMVARLLLAVWPSLLIGDIGETVTARAQAWLERHRTEKFFLWVHYLDPHTPYGDSRRIGSKSFRSDAPFAGTTASDSLGPRFDAIARLRAGEIHLDAMQRRQLLQLYDAGVQYADEQVGRLLDSVDRLDLREHTVIIVASDHGEEFWEHGGVEHGHTVYDELVRVPLILRWPGGPGGRVVSNVVRLMDVAPTIVELTGCGPPPRSIEGRSLRAPAMEEPEGARVAVSEGLLLSDEKRALRTAHYKFIRSANGKEELYDLVNDPGELRDLAAREDLMASVRTWTQQ
jgi:arylsulfatase A-like enzyme